MVAVPSLTKPVTSLSKPLARVDASHSCAKLASSDLEVTSMYLPVTSLLNSRGRQAEVLEDALVELHVHGAVDLDEVGRAGQRGAGRRAWRRRSPARWCPCSPERATSVRSIVTFVPELTTLPLMCRLVAALRSLTAFWTIWSGVPERDVAPDVARSARSTRAAGGRGEGDRGGEHAGRDNTQEGWHGRSSFDRDTAGTGAATGRYPVDIMPSPRQPARRREVMADRYRPPA